MTQRVNEWKAYTVVSESLSKLFVCVCVLCVKLASSSGTMHQIKYTRSDTRSNTHTPGAGLSWSAPTPVWLWSSPQHPLFYSNAAFVLLSCLTCPAGHLPQTHVTPFRSSNRAQSVFKRGGASRSNRTLVQHVWSRFGDGWCRFRSQRESCGRCHDLNGHEGNNNNL